MLSRRFASTRGFATKVTAKEFSGKVSTLTVKVNAGSSVASKDGLAHLLSRFNFHNTTPRSALRLTRESELLGGQFESKVDRETITLSAKFLAESLPYYVNALGDVLKSTSFRPHELPESVLPAAKVDAAAANACPVFKADELLHSLSFRSGLGAPLYFDGVQKISLEDIKEYAAKVYTQSNIEIIASGVNQADLTKFVNDSVFAQLPVGESLAAKAAPKTFEGAETRFRSAGQSVAGVAVPVKTADFATYEVLTAYLNSALSTLNVEAKFVQYSQAGLFTVIAKSSDASAVAADIKAAVAQLKAGLDLSAAKALAATELALAEETTGVKAVDVSAVKNFKLGKFNYVAVGDVNNLPFADEL